MYAPPHPCLHSAPLPALLTHLLTNTCSHFVLLGRGLLCCCCKRQPFLFYLALADRDVYISQVQLTVKGHLSSGGCRSVHAGRAGDNRHPAGGGGGPAEHQEGNPAGVPAGGQPLQEPQQRPCLMPDAVNRGSLLRDLCLIMVGHLLTPTPADPPCAGSGLSALRGGDSQSPDVAVSPLAGVLQAGRRRRPTM